jgi:excisionase family DNA binding protein
VKTSPKLIDAIPTKRETGIAEESKRLLAKHLASRRSVGLRAMNTGKEPAVRIPLPAANLLLQILDQMSRGNAVKVIPVRRELTTQEAADLLNISRPTLIQLLDEGRIDFRKVGTHRRIRVESVVGYKRRLDADRRAALGELSAYDQEIGI